MEAAVRQLATASAVQWLEGGGGAEESTAQYPQLLFVELHEPPVQA